MATSTSHAGVSKVETIDLIMKLERSVDSLRELLAHSDFQVLPVGTNLETYATSGTFQAGQSTENAAVTASTYSNVVTAKSLTVKRWMAPTSVQQILKRGRAAAVSYTDDCLLRDVQKEVITDIMTGISAGASGTAAGVGLQATCADAWAELGEACENENATPVFFCNYATAAAYLGAANVSVQEAFGLKYIVNFLGMGTLIINSNVPDSKVWATAEENLVIAAANLASVPDFDLMSDSEGVLGVAHEKDMSTGSVQTHIWSGLCIFPVYADRFIVGTIS